MKWISRIFIHFEHKMYKYPDCVSNEINHLLCGWWEKSLDISKNSCAMMNVGLQNHK